MKLQRRGTAEWLVVACGVWLVGLGLYFVFLRPALLPEDLRYIGVDAQALRAAVPGLTAWLGKVFTVMGGFMAGAGVLVAYIGWRVMPARPRGGMAALVLAGALTVGLMSAVNFTLHSDFRWLLLAPPLVWIAAVGTYARGRRDAASPLQRGR
jgi:hypothetical protein